MPIPPISQMLPVLFQPAGKTRPGLVYWSERQDLNLRLPDPVSNAPYFNTFSNS